MKTLGTSFLTALAWLLAQPGAAAVASTGWPMAAAAQTTDSLHAEHQLGQVEVRGQQSRNKLSSTVPVQSISKADIATLGITTVGDAVRRMAGVSVRDYGGIGGMQTVSLRSLGACHTAVSYDGFVLSNMQAGQIDVSRYSLFGVSRISVAMGQESDIMQSVRHYASAGILSIEGESPWKGLLDLEVKTGSWGLLQPSLRLAHQWGDRLAGSVCGSLTRADGIYPFTLVNGRERERLKRYNSDVLSGQGEANIAYRWGQAKGDSALHTGSELDAKIGYYNSKRGLPGVVILYNPDTRERMWDENFFAQMMLKTWLMPRLALRARLRYAHSWTKHEDYNVKYAGGKQTDVDRQNEYYLSSTLGYYVTPQLSLALAEDFTLGNLRNNIESQPNPTRYTSQTALSLRWKRQRWQLDGNVVGTYVTEKGEKVTSQVTGATVNARIPADRKRLSPSLALAYRLLTEEEPLYLRLMMKSTYRVPTFTDMYYLRIGNTNLKPENATEWNAGLAWSHGFGGNQVSAPGSWRIQATLDAYLNKVSDKIVAFPSTYVWKMVNFGKASITGVDATLSVGVSLWGRMSVQLDAAYTYQQAIDKTDPQKSYYRHQLPYTPRHRGNVGIVWKSPWLNLGWQMMAQGKQWSMIQGTDEYLMPGYAEHSFTLSRDFLLGGGRQQGSSQGGQHQAPRVGVSFSLLNAFDRQYEVIQYYPMPGRSWRLSAALYI